MLINDTKSDKKYKLIAISHSDTLYRIEALRDFGDVKKGDRGGLIESEGNLSHEGDCWVFGNACVYENAKVCGRAKVYGSAVVYGNAMVFEGVRIFGDACVYGNAWVYGSAEVSGDAVVCGRAKVYGGAVVFGDADVCGSAKVKDNMIVGRDALVCKPLIGLITDIWDVYIYDNWSLRIGCKHFTFDEFKALTKRSEIEKLAPAAWEFAQKYQEAILSLIDSKEGEE